MKNEPKSTDVSSGDTESLRARVRAWFLRVLGATSESPQAQRLTAPVLKQGPAMRVIFFYAGEEGTYVENVNVTVFLNGVVLIESPFETTTVHHQNCEILWRYQVEIEESASTTKGQLRLLRRTELESAQRTDWDRQPPDLEP